MTTYIAYLRVSTDRQEQSGLGLEAQREAVAHFAREGSIIETFVEIESGRQQVRPQLTAALETCRKLGVTLLIAKLDRLARDVAFIANLMKSDVRFIACDMPEADPFRLHIESAIAEEEARKISARTKAALKAAKVRGVKLGGFRGRAPSDLDRRAAACAKANLARQRAKQLAPTLDELRRAGARSLRALANDLNERFIPAPRGGQWSPTQVARALARSIEN